GEMQPLSEGSTARGICPAWPVGEAGEPAYSAATGLLYIAASQLCMDFEPRDGSYLPGTPYTGAYVRMRPARRAAGALIAWDVVARRPAWQVDERFPLRGGVELTPGGVLSYGTLDGTVKALDARDGRVLWQQRLGSGVVARPTAFQGPDGHAWLAVLAGAGPVAGMPAPSEMDLRDATAVKGLAGVLHDLPPPAESGGRLTVFRAP
ncbi:MAG TPA: PQQ-binding-like beta-propeller repeat protein, partial [Acetobacteraceae bacterium]|nr:PQQ-binding-like beta-propeller repeat protein [Acetobacteraceae bacterium]